MEVFGGEVAARAEGLFQLAMEHELGPLVQHSIFQVISQFNERGYLASGGVLPLEIAN